MWLGILYKYLDDDLTRRTKRQLKVTEQVSTSCWPCRSRSSHTMIPLTRDWDNLESVQTRT